MILYLLTAVVLLILAVLVVTEIIDYQVEGLHDICEVNIDLHAVRNHSG